MNDTPNHTIELLKRIRAETQEGFTKLGKAIAELTAENRISNAHIVGLVRFEDYATGRMADLEVRLEKIEKRLQLEDPTLPDDAR